MSGACSHLLSGSADLQVELSLQNTFAPTPHHWTTRLERQESVFHTHRYTDEYIGAMGIYEGSGATGYRLFARSILLVGELADAIDKSQSWTSGVVDDLENAHLVDRTDGVQLATTYEASLLAELFDRYALEKVLTGTKETGDGR